MKIDIDKYKGNCLYTEKDAKGYSYLRRFLPEQYKAYSINGMFRGNYNCSSNAYIGFTTNGDKVSFNCKAQSIVPQVLKSFMEPMTHYQVSAKAPKRKKIKKSKEANAYGDKRMYGMRFELLMEGRSCGTCKAKSGKIEFSLPNSEHRYVEVRIYLPLMIIVGIKDFVIEGEVKEPEKREAILCLGDSITQGLDSFLPSRGYVAQIGEKLKLNAVCQGIAGYTFNAESLVGLEKLGFQPKFICCAYGTNDWQFAPSKAVVEKNICCYFKKLHDLFSDIPIFVITPMWRADEEYDSAAGSMPDLRCFIRTEAGKYENMRVIQGDRLIDHDVRYLYDGLIHPNDAGFDLISERLTQHIQRNLKS